MTLQRGENIRGWEGVTRDLATNNKERQAWQVSTLGLVLVVFVTGMVALLLSKSDIPVVAKALLTALALLGILVLMSGVYSTMVSRASARRSDGEPAAAAPSRPAPVQAAMAAPEPAVTPAPAPPPEPTPVAAAPEPTPPPEPAPAPAAPDPAPAAEAPPAPQPQMAAEIAPSEGTRPQALDGPRDGVGDDLTLIKGVGPALKKLCNSLGFWHFDQIAAWTDAEVAWVDDNLEGFKGRVSRDNWVAQAAELATGAETEFSQRVEDGKVY